ncbi:HAD-IIA family hydrolase [Evansella tamaricis]|uniref:HAD-IIA family hydrolase n=1 Tax=Evansella tamaricis TaxID=2069301 RepID=A0ABS6JDZ9_9BACI|nr:HAD-IIA family hydrolase [Evansella tamaricis]MBU9710675.1 HAD-IIA family hydrolase [Evansella tamaricis]
MVTGLLEKVDAYLFDLDGCIYFGESPAQGAKELVDFLRSKQKKVFFVSNNSTDSAMDIAERLHQMEIFVSPNEIYHPTGFIGDYLYSLHGSVVLKVAGSNRLHESLMNAGHRILPIEAKQCPDWVVVGRDINFTYEKLTFLARDLEDGAALVKTNPDSFHLDADGNKVPETGAIASALEFMSGKKGFVVGKPNPLLLQKILTDNQLVPSQCAMIGDNLLTDIYGGKQAGLMTVWLKGNQTIEQSETVPDITVRTISELGQLLNTLNIKAEV